MVGGNVCGMGLCLWHREGQMGGVGTCSRVWGHVAGGGGMTQDPVGGCWGIWQGIYAYGRARCLW